MNLNGNVLLSLYAQNHLLNKKTSFACTKNIEFLEK